MIEFNTSFFSSEKNPKVEGYMFVFQHERSKELDIQAYLDGRKDAEML